MLLYNSNKSNKSKWSKLMKKIKYGILMFIIFLVNLIIPLNKSFAEEIVNVFPSDGVLKNDTIYQLTEDTKLIKNLSVEKNTVVTIDLNGYVLC